MQINTPCLEGQESSESSQIAPSAVELQGRRQKLGSDTEGQFCEHRVA